MKKCSVFLLLLLILVPNLQSNRELSVDLRLTWGNMSSFSGSKYTYGVELVDWDRCDAVYWDGYRCIFTAGIKISQIERGNIIWQKEYLHLKYGETEINQKFGDIIIKKVKIIQIAFNDGYVDLTIFYENRYVSDEKPIYEKIIGEEETIVHLGDAQNVYSFYVSAFDDRAFYVFYINGEKKSEEGSNILPDERVTLWLNVSIGFVKINNNKIFSVYAPSRFRILKTGSFSVEEKDIIKINGQDFSINGDIIKIGGNEYLLEKNMFIVTSIGWIICRENEITIYAEKIEITEYSPDLKLIYEPCSLLLNEKKTMNIRIENMGKGLADVNFRAYGMGVDYKWDGKLGYEESKEIKLEITPKTMHDTLFAEMNSEKIEIPVTIKTIQETQTPIKEEIQTPVTTVSSPSERIPEKRPLTIFVVILSLTFLAVFGQNKPQKVQKNIPAKKKKNTKERDTNADKKNTKKSSGEKGLPKKPFKYFNKRI